MVPNSASFDGDLVELHYPANPKQRRGWWDGATVHHFSYHPELTSRNRIIEYATHGYRLSRDQRNKLSNLIKPTVCGDGWMIEIHAQMIRRAGGPLYAGGKWPVFLLSPGGRLGTLVIGNSIYHRYNVRRIYIAKMREFSWLPKLTSDPQEIETFTFDPVSAE